MQPVTRLTIVALCLCYAVGSGCKRFTYDAPPPPLQVHRFAVDVTLTSNNLGWEHFTPKDYFNPAHSSRFDVYIVGRYNKTGPSPGLYGWLRATRADSAGHFDYDAGGLSYKTLRRDPIDCPSFIEGGDTAVTAYIGSADYVHSLEGGPGSGYSILIWLAAAVRDAVSDSLCTAGISVAPDDTIHISEIIYKAYWTEVW